MPPDFSASGGHASAKKKNKIPRGAPPPGADSPAAPAAFGGLGDDAMRVSVTWERVSAGADLPPSDADPLPVDRARDGEPLAHPPAIDDRPPVDSSLAPPGMGDDVGDPSFAFPAARAARAPPAPPSPPPPPSAFERLDETPVGGGGAMNGESFDALLERSLATGDAGIVVEAEHRAPPARKTAPPNPRAFLKKGARARRTAPPPRYAGARPDPEAAKPPATGTGGSKRASTEPNRSSNRSAPREKAVSASSDVSVGGGPPRGAALRASGGSYAASYTARRSFGYDDAEPLANAADERAAELAEFEALERQLAGGGFSSPASGRGSSGALPPRASKTLGGGVQAQGSRSETERAKLAAAMRGNPVKAIVVGGGAGSLDAFGHSDEEEEEEEEEGADAERRRAEETGTRARAPPAATKRSLAAAPPAFDDDEAWEDEEEDPAAEEMEEEPRGTASKKEKDSGGEKEKGFRAPPLIASLFYGDAKSGGKRAAPGAAAARAGAKAAAAHAESRGGSPDDPDPASASEAAAAKDAAAARKAAAERDRLERDRAALTREKRDFVRERRLAESALEAERRALDEDRAAANEVSAQIKRDRQRLERESRRLAQAEKAPTKKERSELESLRAQLATTLDDQKTRDARHRHSLERLQARVAELQREQTELKEEKRRMEKRLLAAEAAMEEARDLARPEGRAKGRVEPASESEGRDDASARRDDASDAGGGAAEAEANAEAEADANAEANANAEASAAVRVPSVRDPPPRVPPPPPFEDDPASPGAAAREGGGGGDGRSERLLANGRRVVRFANGTLKDVTPTSSGAVSTVYFTNGDVKRTRPGGAVEYFYAEVETWHATHPGGTEVYHFPSGQTEMHGPNGYKEILFPDGLLRRVFPDGREEDEIERSVS